MIWARLIQPLHFPHHQCSAKTALLTHLQATLKDIVAKAEISHNELLIFFCHNVFNCVQWLYISFKRFSIFCLDWYKFVLIFRSSVANLDKHWWKMNWCNVMNNYNTYIIFINLKFRSKPLCKVFKPFPHTRILQQATLK